MPPEASAAIRKKTPVWVTDPMSQTEEETPHPHSSLVAWIEFPLARTATLRQYDKSFAIAYK